MGRYFMYENTKCTVFLNGNSADRLSRVTSQEKVLQKWLPLWNNSRNTPQSSLIRATLTVRERSFVKEFSFSDCCLVYHCYDILFFIFTSQPFRSTNPPMRQPTHRSFLLLPKCLSIEIYLTKLFSTERPMEGKGYSNHFS